ncbi:MAG: flagellar basal body protein FliL [Treponema sp.]|nr:flagellar basal body protein FliL [Treponema sp.]
MSDADDLDMDGGDAIDTGSSKKKRGLGALLPTVLKFAAIGIALIIVIVTVCWITIDLMMPSGESQTPLSGGISSPYKGTLETLDWFTGLGEIRTQILDNWSVSININLGYTKGDLEASGELSDRRLELRDFLRNYFAKKYIGDLQPDKEERLKMEIREILNDRYLNSGKIRNITFDTFDRMEL